MNEPETATIDPRIRLIAGQHYTGDVFMSTGTTTTVLEMLETEPTGFEYAGAFRDGPNRHERRRKAAKERKR